MDPFAISSEEVLKAMLDWTWSWEYLVDPSGRIVCMTPSCERITGYRPEEYADDPGLLVRVVHPKDRANYPALEDEGGPPAVRDAVTDIFLRILHKDGSTRWIRHVRRPLTGPGGEFMGWRVSNSEVTERKRVERELEMAVMRLDLCLNNAMMGTWDWDLRTGSILFDSRWADMLGCRPEEIPPGIAGWESRVHPEDLGRMHDLLQDHLLGKTVVYEAEFRMRHRGGRWVWVKGLGRVIARDDRGDPARFFGVNLDISSQKVMGEMLRQSEERFRVLMESGKREHEASPFQPKAEFERVVRLQAPYAEEKHLGFRVSISPDIPDTLVGDPLRLNQVLMILIGNAVKFTDKGEVRFSARWENGEGTEKLLIEISDSGQGIAPEKLGRLFGPFGLSATSPLLPGQSGMGLAMCKHFVDRMGGDIQVSSQPGQGSRFEVVIPFRREAAGAQPFPRSQPAAAAVASTFGPLRILLVDDVRLNRELVARILTKIGHAVDLAEDGEESVRLFGQARYDLVLMDIQMPVMDGLEATRKIRELEAADGRRTPVIAMTGQAVDGFREECLGAGMDDVLTKPLRRDEIVTMISRHCPQAK